MMQKIYLNTVKRVEFVDITSVVKKIITNENIKQGICVLFCGHTTAGLTINENADPSVKKDIMNHLAVIVPRDGGFSHAEDNSDSHIKSSLIGSSLSLIIEDNSIVLGQWQGIYFCEFDGPRQRIVFVKIIKG